jgi:threonine dehydratase
VHFDYIKEILKAPVYDVAIDTPVDTMNFLSQRFKNKILIKREDLQPVFSFKIRGAYNKIVKLSDEDKKAGVIAASAGNHAQGVALAASKIGVKAVIVMPVTTPAIKVDSVRARGAEIVLHGDAFPQAFQKSREIAKANGYTYIHPFDDPYVIAGQGTIGMEIMRRQDSKLDAIFVPVGGGGLLAGISVYVKFLNPDVKIIGVESEDSACLKAAMDKGERVTLDEVGIFADGVAVSLIGENTFSVIRHTVDEVITVDTDEICAAIKDIYDDTRSITEPAGALAIAGLKKYVEENEITGSCLMAINSGANINFDRLRHISERTELGEKREGIFAVEIPERPGSFRRFCQILENRNITEFNYRYADSEKAMVFVGVQLEGGEQTRIKIMDQFEKIGYYAIDLSEDEVSKMHIRHMVGGHAPGIENEKVFIFEFPERPKSLVNFLDGLGQDWNISMFHYRNHGAAYGRVLAGLQITESELTEFKSFIDRIGYRYQEITDNVAYKLFLGKRPKR